MAETQKQKKMKLLPNGVTDFESIRKNGLYFVDKSAYIRKVEEINRYFFFIRPRRFGKSLLLSMLQCYYDVNKRDQFEDLFGELEIGKEPTPLHNSYLILALNLSRITGTVTTYQESLDRHCENAFQYFCRVYASLLPENALSELSTKTGALMQLEYLCNLCNQVGRKIYLFIDEYDHFTNNILASENSLNAYKEQTHGTGYLREFFNAIKANTTIAIERMFITGVSPVTMDDLTSGFNIATNYTTRETFNAMVGFSEKDVREMLTYYSGYYTFNHSIDELIALMRPWYDNYCFSAKSQGDESMYNSYMVLYFMDYYLSDNCNIPNAMIDGNVKTDYNKLRMLIRKDKELNPDTSTIQEIITNGFIVGEIKEYFSAHEIVDPDNFASLLYYFGMLTYGGYTEKGKCKLIIPNQAVREQMYGFLQGIYKDIAADECMVSFASCLEDMVLGDGFLPVFEEIERRMRSVASVRDIMKGEKFIHGFCLSALASTSYFFPVSEADANTGYPDLFLLARHEVSDFWKHSYLIEFKYIVPSDSESLVEKKREEAIAQLKEYAASPKIQEIAKNTILHSLAVVFHGMDLKVCEEV